jgi:2-dehydro-3-deoxygluconokinase
MGNIWSENSLLGIAIDAYELRYFTSLFTDGKSYNSAEFSCEGVVDKLGSEDCFMAGLIYGFYNQHQPQEIIDYATTAAFGKLQEHGDATGQDVLTVKKKSGG